MSEYSYLCVGGWCVQCLYSCAVICICNTVELSKLFVCVSLSLSDTHTHLPFPRSVLVSSFLVFHSIVTAFTIEPNLADFPDSPNKNVRRPIKGIMTTHGYCLPDPATPNRLSIWFTGGKITPNDDPHDEREWKRLFGKYTTLPQRTFGEKVRVLAANLLMGAKVPQEMLQDGTMEFHFTRPLGGHGVAYNDVVYMDDSMRIVKGHRGTIFVFARIPE